MVDHMTIIRGDYDYEEYDGIPIQMSVLIYILKDYLFYPEIKICRPIRIG